MVGPLGGNLHAQRAHRRDRPCASDIGMVFLQPRINRLIGALQRR
jgi:hypothetical protein